MAMKGDWHKSFVVVAGLVAAGLVVVVVALLFKSGSGTNDTLLQFRIPTFTTATNTPVATSQPQSKITTTSGIERWYTNTTLNFSFRLPDGFSAPDIDTDVAGVYGTKVYNDSGSVLTVLVYPLTEGPSITIEDIRANLPGTVISGVQEGFIGTVVRGISFRTNAEEWGGDGIAFWVAYNGHVYQLSAARKDQDLMDFVVANWFFAPPTPPQPQR